MIEGLSALLCGSIAAVAVLGLIAGVAKSLLHICEPNEILVFSGKQRKLADGTKVGFRIIFGGMAWRTPIVERVERMDVRNIAIDIRTTNAYSKGGIPLNVHAIANCKVSKNPAIIGNAIERFLGRDPSEIKRVAKETLEGHLRGVLAGLTPEEVNEDRLRFAEELTGESDEDFRRLGLQLDTLKIQSVTDDVNYLNSIGRKSIADVLRDAKVAEANNLSEAEQAEAKARQAGEVASQKSQAAIIQAKNGVAQAKAEFDAKANSEDERTAQAALLARAEAELELQEIRKQLEELRLMADVVLPAQAAQEAETLRARGNAAYAEQSGRASAEVLQLMTDAWNKAGDDAKDIFLIQNLETVLETVVEKVNAIEVDEVTLLDDGGGTALPAHVSSYPAMVSGILGELHKSTGVDVVGILATPGIDATTDSDEKEDN
ncbi:MAG TPA: SPFH domain-containing protein [Myxococcota bacterium]|nr:SPFH domain-containing protein [Myxococcota bacterium]